MLKYLNEVNEFKIYSIYDEEFREYGRVLDIGNVSPIVDYLNENTTIPLSLNMYKASDEGLEALPLSKEMQCNIFGGIDIQVGYCNGNNSYLNAFEYHKSSEVNISSTGMVLFLGKVWDIKNNYYNTDYVKVFYVPESIAIEIYATTLHFAPSKINGKGFKCLVALPRGTNTPLNNIDTNALGENRLLFMKNKWLLAHGDKKELIEKGAFKGLVGKNLECKY